MRPASLTSSLSTSLLILLAIGCGPGIELPPTLPPEVTTAKAIKREVVEFDEYTGHVEAEQTVDVYAKISGYMDTVEFTDGEKVIEQGEKGDNFYIMVSGKVDCLVEGVGKVMSIPTEEGRRYFGELALLYNAPRAATCQSVGKCEAWMVDRTTSSHRTSGPLGPAP